MSFRPRSATVLALGCAILMIKGLYFVFIRPPLLPEDMRYMGTSMVQIQAPGIAAIVIVSGLASITWMGAVSFMIGSANGPVRRA